MSMDREQETFVSRRSVFTAAAALAGTALGAAPLAVAKAAATEDDALLIDAWAKYQAAMDHNRALNEKMEPLYQAARAALPPHMEKEKFLSLTEAEREAYDEQRICEYERAWDETGLTAAEREQQHFLDMVVDPLEAAIINTVPTTMKGVAIKAAYLLKYGRIDLLDTDRPEDLDYKEGTLHKLVHQLAALPVREV
jgi:hypothetical protein